MTISGSTGLFKKLDIIAVTIPFDIRDLKYDSSSLATIPQKIGVRRTKYLGLMLLVLIVFSEFFKDEITAARIVVLIVISVLTGLFVSFSSIYLSFKMGNQDKQNFNDLFNQEGIYFKGGGFDEQFFY